MGFRLLVSPKVLAKEDRLHCIGDVELPEDGGRILHLGPKFAVQPWKDAVELLACVREVARRAPDDERDYSVAQGVDVLTRCRQQLPVVLSPVWTYPVKLRQSGLKAPPSPRIGGMLATLWRGVGKEWNPALHTGAEAIPWERKGEYGVQIIFFIQLGLLTASATMFSRLTLGSTGFPVAVTDCAPQATLTEPGSLRGNGQSTSGHVTTLTAADKVLH
ncbi:hypothetical protein MRX96_038485 [Rhipicephalus microplus]